jgi:hypothetical protein
MQRREIITVTQSPIGRSGVKPLADSLGRLLDGRVSRTAVKPRWNGLFGRRFGF